MSGYERRIPAEFLLWAIPSAGLLVICVQSGGPLPPGYLSIGLWALVGLAAVTVLGMAVRGALYRGNPSGRIGNRPGPRYAFDDDTGPDVVHASQLHDTKFHNTTDTDPAP